MTTERYEALRDAAAAMCPTCHARRRYPRPQVVVSKGRFYHFDGTLEYADGSTRDFLLRCEAGPIQGLLEVEEQRVKEGAEG